MNQHDEGNELTKNYEEAFGQLVALHQRLKTLHPSIYKCYPVALAEAQQLAIYDINADTGQYQFIQPVPLPMPVPKGVRSAFQLEDYGGRIACVVTPEIFDSPDGFITILHEFVHCYQYETCEQELKGELDIARKAQEVGDCMWEIEHPFPYESINFTRGYMKFLSAVAVNDHGAIQKTRSRLRSYLGVHDYEYMVWQEWKEGFARWVENRVNVRLDLPVNIRGLIQPFSRILFYAGGEAYIDYWVKHDRKLARDLRGLFRKIHGDMPGF